MMMQAPSPALAGRKQDPQALFSAILGQCRGATESLSQAETLCGQFAAMSRRGFAQPFSSSAQFSNGQQQQQQQLHRHPAEEQISKIEDAMQHCANACAEARQSPLWAVSDMATLQALSALQRQRLDSMRSDVEDTERQMRIVNSRYQPNLAKYRNTFGEKDHQSMQQQQVDHVQQVLQQGGGNGTGRYYEKQPDPNESEASLRGKERESIQRVATGVRNLVSESNAALAALRSQRERVQGTDSKLGQVLTSAGVAQSVVRQLERMTVIDRIIVFGGISGLCLLMLYLWIFV